MMEGMYEPQAPENGLMGELEEVFGDNVTTEHSGAGTVIGNDGKWDVYQADAQSYPRPHPQDPTHIIPATHYAGPYRSTFTRSLPADMLPLLSHVNCSYLSSSTQRIVTLLDLKRHAQALTVLIRHLGPSTGFAPIDGANLDQDPRWNDVSLRAKTQKDEDIERLFPNGEVFDWLNDLNKPYDNEHRFHNQPLTSLMQEMKAGLIPLGFGAGYDLEGRTLEPVPVDQCPLHRTAPSHVERQQLYPLATPEALAKHADEVLERLDYEFAAYGGLLGMLPVNGDADPRGEGEVIRNIGEKTVLGQWIAFTRGLVQRCHELERALANALDVLAGEAVVPRELLSEIGAEARTGSLMAYPQDRFVLCNLKGGYWEALNKLFLDKEKTGGIGSGADGLAWVDVKTRYFKTNGQAGTIFVAPQLGQNMETLQMEKRPTVVQVRDPRWTDRASEWEKRNIEPLKDAESWKIAMEGKDAKIEELERSVATLRHEKDCWKSQKQAMLHLKDNPLQIDFIMNRAREIEHLEAIKKKREELEAREREVARREWKLKRMDQKMEESLEAWRAAQR